MAEFRDPLDNTCEGCKYNRQNNEGNCSRYVKFINNKRVLCGRDNDNTLGNSDDSNCLINMCPEHCFLYDELLNDTRYFGNASNVFTDNISTVEELFQADQNVKNNFLNGISVYEDIINDGPYNPNHNVTSLMEKLNGINGITGITGISEICINGSGCDSNEIDIINDNRTESGTGVIAFKCGETVYEYGNHNLPNVGTDPLVNQTSISRLATNDGSMFQGIKWDSLSSKYRESGLQDDLNLFLDNPDNSDTINIVNEQNFTSSNFIVYHQNGIDFSSLPRLTEWKDISNDNSETELLRILELYNLTKSDLPNIYAYSTKKMISLLKGLGLIINSSDSNSTNSLSKSMLENKICFDAITEYGNRRMLLMGITDEQPVDFRITKLVDIFGLTKDTSTNRELEHNLNILLDTDDGDDEYMDRIGNYNSIEELGRNLEDIQYIERKIKKFLGTNTEEFVSVYDSAYTYEEICTGGFSERPMKILGNLMNLDIDHDGDITQQDLSNEKRVFRIILKYIPSLMRKVLDISERLEILKCDRVTKKTQIYKEIYKDLFIDSNVLKFELPDLGISDFFKDFNHNIYTKIILLIFIGFIISRIISLFTVNVQVKT